MIQSASLFLVLLISVTAWELYEGDRCVDHNSKEGKCAQLEKCLRIFKDLPKGVRPITCSGLPRSLLICCPEDTRSLSVKKCDEYTESVVRVTHYGPLIVNPSVKTIKTASCEYNRVELIVGGEDAKLGEFPHMAAIGWTDGNVYDFKCGGTLISPNFVMTAAHCLMDTRSFAPAIVRLGDLNIDPAADDKANPIDIGIKSMTSHPNYQSPKKYYDIGLIELNESVTFDKFIRPACLWTKDDFGGNDRAIATGWGVTNPMTNRRASTLQKVALPLLPNELCDDALMNLRSRLWREGFDETQMCAGEIKQGKDSCEGDSGGPLQITHRNNSCIFYVIGVTSFGPKFCGPRPAVYTKVSKFVPWIESIVWPGES